MQFRIRMAWQVKIRPSGASLRILLILILSLLVAQRIREGRNWYKKVRRRASRINYLNRRRKQFNNPKKLRKMRKKRKRKRIRRVKLKNHHLLMRNPPNLLIRRLK